MPMLRARGGTCTPRSGTATSSPPIEMVPPVGCASPAMHRSVVVLPQPEGPSSTTISPAAMRKLTSSTAGRPTRNCLRRCETISSADIQRLSVFSLFRSFPRKRESTSSSHGSGSPFRGDERELAYCLYPYTLFHSSIHLP